MGRIRTLQTVDGVAITQEEASMAMKRVVSSHLTMTTLLEHAYSNVTPLPSLSVQSVAQTLHNHQISSMLHINSTSGTEWHNKVWIYIRTFLYCECVVLSQ